MKAVPTTAISSILRMKSWATALALLALTASTRAGVIAYDDLEDAVLGSLDGQTSGIGFAAGYVTGSGANAVVTNMSLSYSSGQVTVDGGTNCVRIGYPDQVEFTRAIGSQAADEIFLSFLFRTPTADGSSNEDFLSVGFSDGVSEPEAGVVHRFNLDKDDHYFALRGTSSDYERRTTFGTTADETYFVVFRLRKLTPGIANKFNELSMFINPVSAYEPAPDLVYTNTSWSAAAYLGSRLALSESTDVYFLDNLCIGETYDDVVFPNGSPVVTAPVILPLSGEIAGMATVSITTATENASIRYTTDGTDPSSTVGTLYTAPFTLDASTEVRAVAYKDGLFDSPITTTEYRVFKHWTGLGADDLWSTADNWHVSGSPVGADLMFESADTNSTETVNNIVAASLTVSSLSYTNLGNTSYHVTQIDPGVTLSIDGSSSPVNAFLVGRTESTTKGDTRTRVTLTGGGSFVVNAPESDALITTRSNDRIGLAYLDVSGLDQFDATVKDFAIGRYGRSSAQVTLSPTNRITATNLMIGNSEGESDSGTTYLYLGRDNALYADTLYVGAGEVGYQQVAKAYIEFQSMEGDAPVLKIRARDGTSAADAVVAFLGANPNKMLNRSLTAGMDFTGGVVDAKFGELLIGQHQAYTGSGKTGGATGWMNMSNGIVEASSVLLGRTIRRSSSGANPALGIINVMGGLFKAESMSLGNNASGTDSGGKAHGVINVLGAGSVEVSGDVTLGTRESGSPEVVGRIVLSNGTMRVLGNMMPNSSYVTNIVSEVYVSGGALFVTNATGTGTVRIENGTFAIASGTALLDRLVTTNALCTTQVTLAGTETGEYGQVAVNDSVLLGGTLDVTFAEGYAPSGGEVWKIVQGPGGRTGKFAVEDLPENFKVVYTPDGYWIANPAKGTTLIVR